MTLKEIWNNRSWRFTFWLTAALLAYRTAPDTGVPMTLSVCTGVLYLVMWALMIHLDAKGKEKVSPLMKFILFLMILMCVTLVADSMGKVLTSVALLWLVPMGLPIQALVRLVSEEISLSDSGMAMVALGLAALLLIMRTVLHIWFSRCKKG